VLESSTRLARHLDWPGVAQVCRLTRRVHRQGAESVEVAYALTSVPRSLADPMQLLHWWRGQWLIENRLHWVRDVVLGEDGCRIRVGTAPQAMSSLRNAVLNLLRTSGFAKIAATLRQNAYRVDLLFARLGILNL
jgi:predicted transposase YbfD/YdcC